MKLRVSRTFSRKHSPASPKCVLNRYSFSLSLKTQVENSCEVFDAMECKIRFLPLNTACQCIRVSATALNFSKFSCISRCLYMSPGYVLNSPMCVPQAAITSQVAPSYFVFEHLHGRSTHNTFEATSKLLFPLTATFPTATRVEVDRTSTFLELWRTLRFSPSTLRHNLRTSPNNPIIKTNRSETHGIS